MIGEGGLLAEDRAHILLDEAFVLHRRPYRETSLLVDIISSDFGRTRLLAKGARCGKTSRSHLLQPFVPLRLSWTGRAELPVLTGVEIHGKVSALEGSALFCGFYLNELLLKLLPLRDPQPEILALYRDGLARLGAGECQERVLRFFEMALLSQIGYGLCLDCEIAAGRRIDAGNRYIYVIGQGLIEAGESGVETIRGSTLIGLSRGTLDKPDELREAKRLMRQIIHHHLNGRTLRSRELFKPVGRYRTT